MYVFPSVTFLFLFFYFFFFVVVSKKEELNEYKIAWELGTSSNSGKASFSL